MEKEGKTKSLAQIAADDIIKLIKIWNQGKGLRMNMSWQNV